MVPYFKQIYLALSLCLFASVANAEEIREIYSPTRPTGMGGAFTAIANDENSVWTNPAGIARLRKARSRKPISLITVPNATSGANNSARKFYTGLRSTDDIAETIADSEVSDDKPFWAMFSVAPLAFFDAGGLPMATGFYSNTVTKIVPNAALPTESKVDALTDLGALYSFAFTNSSNRFSIGAQARYVNRYALESTVETASLQDLASLKTQFEDHANSATAVAIDAGMMFTLADFWFPTLGISVLNAPLGCQENYLNPFAKERQTVCGTVFTGDIANQEALTTVDPTDIRVGLSISPRLSRTIGLRMAVDMHNISFASGDTYIGQPGIPIMKTLHAGAELFYGNPLMPNPVSLRLGASQGFVSYGASLRLGALAMEMAVYGRDISNDDTPREDRRILGSLSLEF